MLLSLCACLLGFSLDLLIGDPEFKFHPIRLIGNLIIITEKFFRKIFRDTERGQLLGGFCMTMVVSIIAFLVPYVLLVVANLINPMITFLVESILCGFALSTKSLKVEAMKIFNQLSLGDIKKSRQALSMIVGRDTNSLSEEGIIKATVETVAENTTDGVIAPMLFMLIGGAPFAYFYKAVNTMDSMVGYKNDKYIFFGRFSAKLDDTLNFLPARIAAHIMIVAAYLLNKYDGKNARKIYLRDRFKHASPNSAHTESVCAGALKIQLAGDAYYFGVKHKKEYIGDPIEEIKPMHISKANKLMYTATGLSLLVFASLKFLIIYLMK